MRSDNSKGSRAASARGFMALCAALAMGLGALASPAAAAPFAYVTNQNDTTVSVIDTATNPPSVVATVTVAGTPAALPQGIAVTPDGKHAYVTLFFDNSVSVIDTASNTVVGTPIGVLNPEGVAVTPDGTRAYVTHNNIFGSVTVIDTASNTVVGTPIPLGTLDEPYGIAITPDGKHAYVTNNRHSTSVWVIDTATNTLAATIEVGSTSAGLAVTPDGKHAYVATSNNVSVIATATNTVVATVAVIGGGVAITPDGKHVYVTGNVVSVIDTATNTVGTTVPVGGGGVAVTPDGKHVYVANFGSNNVSVIDTATNTVEAATITVGNGPFAVGIVPPPPGVPFLAFKAKLEIDLDRNQKEDRFELQSHFTLSSTAPAIHPHRDPVTLQIGTFSITIPPGSFKKHEDEDEHEHENGFFKFHGVIDGVRLEALIKRTGTLRYAFFAEAKGANLAGTKNPVQVSLTIGGNTGTTSVKADIDH